MVIRITLEFFFLIENSSYDNIGSETISEKIAKDLRIKISDVEKISERVIKKDLLLDHAFNNEDDNRTPLDFLNDNSLVPPFLFGNL